MEMSLLRKCSSDAMLAIDAASSKLPASSSTCTSTLTDQALDPDMMQSASVSIARASFNIFSSTLVTSAAASDGRPGCKHAEGLTRNAEIAMSSTHLKTWICCWREVNGYLQEAFIGPVWKWRDNSGCGHCKNSAKTKSEPREFGSEPQQPYRVLPS